MITPNPVVTPAATSFYASMLLLFLAGACAPEEYKYAKATPRKTDRDPAEEPACPRFDSNYRDDFKACEVDEDCTTVAVVVSCAGTEKAYGIATALVDAFLECVPRNFGRVCEVFRAPTRAEDERPSASETLDDVEARCVSGMCQTRIARRACGSEGTVCEDGDLCVGFQTTTFVEYECVPNPCEGEEIACGCADPVCLRKDRPLTCVVEGVMNSDVYCRTLRH